jgi:hypothetical protein
MRPQNRQSVGVVLTLAGHQETAVAAQQPQTDSASISVRIGRALIYLHDQSSVESYVRAWHSMSSDAAGLARSSARAPIQPVTGMTEPAVVINASGTTTADWRLLGGRTGNCLRLVIGRLLVDVRDVAAFASTMLAFREADLLAKETFLDASVPPFPLRQRAVETAAAAFHASSPTQRTSSTAGHGPSPSAAVVPQRPKLSPGWMR